MYTLEAFLARYKVLERALELFPSATLVALPQDIGMIPVDGFLLRELEVHYQGGTKVTRPKSQRFSPPVHPSFERLIVGVEELAKHLSHRGVVAYVEATFVGGYGGHATMTWVHGKRTGAPGTSINDVLETLTVVPLSGSDAFATIDLGRHRSTRKWLDEGKP